MANFNMEISSALSTGWEYAKKYGLLVAVIYLVVGMVTSALSSIGGTVDPEISRQIGEAAGRGDWESVAQYAEVFNTASMHIGSVFTWLVEAVISVALYNLALGLMSGRFSEVTFDAFKLPFSTYLKVVAVSFITGIIIFVSTLFCVIPVFFVAPRLILAPVYQTEHPEAGVFESISAAWHMTTGNTFSMLGLGFVVFGIIILGFCCCCIGVYFAQAIELFVLIAAYNQLKGNLQTAV